MSQLKLFVVGESSGDPERWSEYSERVFVIAADKEEARAIAGDLVADVAAEVELSKPGMLAYRRAEEPLL
jgi:hypothetical protein